MTSILKYLNRALLVLLLAAFAACSDNEGGNESNGNGDDGNTETPADGDTYGYIKDTNGNPVEGVVVSDGYSVRPPTPKGVTHSRATPTRASSSIRCRRLTR